MGQRTLWQVQDGWGTLGEFRDGSREPRGGPKRVGGLSRRFGTGQETLGQVRDGSRDPSEGVARFVGPSGRSGKGSGDSQAGTGRVGGLS